MAGVEFHSVGKYIKASKEKELDAFTAKKPTGAPRKLSPDQKNEVVELITNKMPSEVGFHGRKNWNIELVRQWIITNLNISIKLSCMAVILHRLNLSYTKPTYVLKKSDPEKCGWLKSSVINNVFLLSLPKVSVR